MKSNRFLLMAALVAVFSFSSCQKEEDAALTANPVSESTLAQIKNLGFSTENVQRIDDGYLIEGDIHMTDKEINEASKSPALRVGESEQYRTYNLVGYLPRTITIAMSNTLPYSYVAALDEAIARYNAQRLRISFRRVSSNANIVITRSADNLGYLAYAGFPSGGQPYNRVVVNVSAFGTNPYRPYLASVLAHEIGHCIGFRHTDYFNRSYSCGGAYSNEGAGNIGAIQIPGTPSGPDASSWMMACFGYNQNRPFNYNDRTALNYLY